MPAADRELLYVVALTPEAGWEQRFDQWYDTVHLPELLACPGFRSAERFAAVGGRTPHPPYLALYRVTGPEAFDSEQYRRLAARTVPELHPLAQQVAPHKRRELNATYRPLGPAAFPTGGQRRLPAVFMRGGTSKALLFRRSDLPPERADWDEIFLRAIGSPDEYRRQLNGLGGGVSSVSKVCVVGPSERADADVEFTFAAVAVSRAHVDYAATCGNMAAAIGPFAVDEGLVAFPSGPEAVVRIRNTNTDRVIVSRFPMAGNQAAVTGELAIDGVAGTGAPVRLDFLDPAGASTGALLPTGHPLDVLTVAGIGSVHASMIDAALPCVFLAAAELGLTGVESPDELGARPDLLDALEAIRCSAAVAMGIAPELAAAAAIESIPKVGVLAGPVAATTLTGRRLAGTEVDLQVRMISMGDPHRAIPLTGGLCLGVAARTPGTIAHQLAGTATAALRLGHPSGVLLVDADVRVGQHDAVEVGSATVYRTARRLFEGFVCF